MAAADFTAVIAQLDGAVTRSSAEQRVQLMRGVTELFLAGAASPGRNQLRLFDEILACLINRVEAKELAELSRSLAQADPAPPATLQQLAFHRDPAVATPVLANSKCLSANDLIEIANTAGQPQLLAICKRTALNEALTSALIARGNASVRGALAANRGARISQSSFSILLKIAESDAALAEQLAGRPDFPSTLLRRFIAAAGEASRTRFIKCAHPALQPVIRAAMAVIEASQVVRASVDYSQAKREVEVLNRVGKLGDSSMNRFAVTGDYVMVTAALALLTGIGTETMEPLLGSERLDELVMACKAARLNWSTTRMIIRNRPDCLPLSGDALDQAEAQFAGMHLSEAQWAIRFGQGAVKNPRDKAAALQA